jgi:hypothetical protein
VCEEHGELAVEREMPPLPTGWKIDVTDDTGGRTWLIITSPTGDDASLSCNTSTSSATRTIVSRVLHDFRAAVEQALAQQVPVADNYPRGIELTVAYTELRQKGLDAIADLMQQMHKAHAAALAQQAVRQELSEDERDEWYEKGWIARDKSSAIPGVSLHKLSCHKWPRPADKDSKWYYLCDDVQKLMDEARATAPLAQPAVPESRPIHSPQADEPQVDEHGRYFWRVGWNACRDAVIAAAPAQKE